MISSRLVVTKGLVGILALGLTAACCSVGNCRRAPEPEARLSDLVLCRGWDGSRYPEELPQMVAADEDRICICGDLYANQRLTLQVIWYRGERIVLSDVRVFDPDFLSCIDGQGGFEAGSYRAMVFMGKTEIGLVEFQVSAEE